MSVRKRLLGSTSSWLRWQVWPNGMRDNWLLWKLERDEASASRALSEKQMAVSSEGQGWEYLQQQTSGEYHDYLFASALVEDQLTKMLIAKARRLRVPVPDRTTDAWEESMLGKNLTAKAALDLRREIALEIETNQKPFLNWGALLLSIFSLAVSIVALLNGGG